MREILFRGKQKGNGKWVFGCYYKQSEFYGSKVDDHIIITSHEDLFYDQALDFSIVRHETVGQFTGLTDKNGKKIFEGDIIHAHYANAPKADFVEQVAFCDGRFCSLFSTTDGSGKMWSALPLSAPHIKNDKSIYMEWCEVIGNIHDNPELLEG
jgi:uncharacterized phage protein (TIGR01671 family)